MRHYPDRIDAPEWGNSFTYSKLKNGNQPEGSRPWKPKDQFSMRNAMFVEKNHCIMVATLVFCFSIDHSALAQEKPDATLKAAIEAHGGEAKIAKTLIGTLNAKATFTFAPGMEGAVSWQETFELPRRYHRTIKGQLMG